MSLVAERAALVVLIHHLVYCQARCVANPKTQVIAPPLAAALTALLAAVATRDAAANQTLLTSALRDYATEALTEGLVPIGQVLAAANGGSRMAPGYLRIFSKSPSELAQTPQKDQEDVFDKLVKALQDPQTPKTLNDLVKAFVAHHALLKTAIATDKAADQALTNAVANVGSTRASALDALATADAELRKLFPRQRKKVATFFPKGAKKGGKTPGPTGS